MTTDGTTSPPNDDDALEGLSTAALTDLLYRELRLLARSRQRGDRIAAQMDPTSLVHRAYERLATAADGTWRSREHFVAAAAEAMRRVCIDEARAQGTLKRGGDRVRVPLSAVFRTAHAGLIGEDVDLLELSDALERLVAADGRAANIVKMRFFAGLTIENVAVLLGVDSRTVDRDWLAARAWLFADLKPS